MLTTDRSYRTTSFFFLWRLIPVQLINSVELQTRGSSEKQIPRGSCRLHSFQIFYFFFPCNEEPRVLSEGQEKIQPSGGVLSKYSVHQLHKHTHTRSLQGWSWSGLMLKSSVGSAHGFFNFKRVKYFLQPDIERFFFFFPLRPPPRVTPSPPPPYSPGDIFICRHRVCVCVLPALVASC